MKMSTKGMDIQQIAAPCQKKENYYSSEDFKNEKKEEKKFGCTKSADLRTT